jgi:hypothetical protein
LGEIRDFCLTPMVGCPRIVVEMGRYQRCAVPDDRLQDCPPDRLATNLSWESHASPRATKLHDRTGDEITRDEA